MMSAPVALCPEDGTPLVSTLEVPHKEWWCGTCRRFHEWLHATAGTGPNPTPELIERARVEQEKYDAERAERARR